MNASWFPMYAAQIERQKDLLRRAEHDAKAMRLRRESRALRAQGRRAAGCRDTTDAAQDAASASPVARGTAGSFERLLASFVRDALGLAVRSPRLSRTLFRISRVQRRAARTRQGWSARGVHVPPLMIASITETCNLRCRGCYAMAHRTARAAELSTPRWSGLFREASQLGVSFVLVAGGEPLARWEVVEAAGEVPGALFAVFTNGMLIDDLMVQTIRRRGNIIPVVSLEGPRELTDRRRGSGVYHRVMEAMGRLGRAGVLFGTSITVTSENLEAVTDRSFVDGLLDAGCRLVVYVEYTPIQEGTTHLAPSPAQRAELDRRVRALRRGGRALFVSFPGDEERFGGCLAAGRGFFHVDAQGRLEPCPFAPFSDASVRDQPLVAALASPLLARIRERHAELTETGSGCALWARRDWVQQMLRGDSDGGDGDGEEPAAERAAG